MARNSSPRRVRGHRTQKVWPAKRAVAQDLVDSFINTVTDIWSGEDPDTILEAYNEGKKPVGKPGKKSARQQQKNNKLEEAKSVQASAAPNP